MPGSLRQFVKVLAALMVAIYLMYRGMFTLNLSTNYAIVASLLLYVAEVWGCFLMLLYFVQIWDTQSPEPVEPVDGFTVDVLIPTYNEEPDLLRGTIEAAKAMDYPHRTYVLDDGHREEVRDLCEELGVNYIAREKNIHAKAGNINNALDLTDGELVVIFDADHVAQRNFLTRLVGYFVDERLAFVQTPHSYYNFDSFQSDLDYARNHYWEEGELFYNVIQPGKNYWNAVSFCGSAAMFRRSALEDVGLVATDTITEDMHTGLRLHAAGWKSIFVNERLIVAQAAGSVKELATQRLRWCSGNLSIVWHDNPLFMRGLTIAQRINYMGSMLGWTIGWSKLAVYVTPILLLFTGVAPVDKLDLPLAIITLTYLVVMWTAVKVAGNGHGNLLLIEQMSMNDFWTQIRGTIRALFGMGSRKFVVTKKSGFSKIGASELHLYLPQALLIILGFSAIIWGVVRYSFGVSHDIVGLILGTVLVAVQTTWAWSYLRKAFGARERREVVRHPVATVYAGLSFQENGEPVAIQAVSTDINERGLGLIAYRPLPEGQEVELRIRGGAFATRCLGVVRNCRQVVPANSDHGPHAYRCGIEFLDLTSDQLRSLWSIGTQYAVKRQYKRFDAHAGIRGESTGGWFQYFRRQPDVHLPLLLGVNDPSVKTESSRAIQWRGAVTEWVDMTAFEVLLDGEWEEGQPVRFRADTPFGPVAGTGHVSEVADEWVGGERLFRHEIEMTRFDAGTRMNLQSLLGITETARMRRVVRHTPSKLHPVMARPLGMVAVPAMLLTASLMLVFQYAFQDWLLLDRVARTQVEQIRPEDRERLLAMFDATIGNPPDNIAQLYGLRNALQKVGEQEKADRLAGPILLIDPLAIDTQIAYAESLADQGNLAAAQRVLENQVIPLTREQYEQAFQAFQESQANGSWYQGNAAAHLAQSAATRDRTLLLAARNALNLQNPTRSLELFREVVEPKLRGGLEEADTALATEFAGILLQSGESAEALEVLRQVPSTPQSLELLAGAASMQRDFTTAAEAYRTLLEMRPDDDQALRRLADVLSWEGDYTKAIALYQRLRREHPEDTLFQQELQERLGRVYLWNEQFPQALDELTPLVAEADISSDLWEDFLDAARGVETLSDEQRAQLNRLRQASDQLVDQRRMPLVTRLADVENLHGDAEAGIALLEQYVAVLPTDSPDVLVINRRLADLYLQTERPRDALRIYVNMTPDELGLDGLRKMAAAYLMVQNFESALDIYKQIVDRHPDDLDARRWLADVYSWQGQHLQAISQFRELIKRDPDNTLYKLRLAQVQLWDEQFQAALEGFQPLLVAVDYEDPIWRDYLDAAAGATSLTDEQLATVDAVFGQRDALLEDERYDLLSRLADVYATHGQHERALSLLNEVRERGAEDREIRIRLANVLAQLDRPAEALEMLDGVELTTGDKYLLAGVYAMLKRFDEAVAIYREIVADTPDDPRARELLADAYSWNEDHTTAARLYRQLLERDTNNRGLQLKLARTLLYDRKFDESVERFTPLMDPESNDWTLWRDFVDAAAGAQSLRPATQRIVDDLAARREELLAAGQTRLVRRLADIYIEQAAPADAIAILQRILTADPEDRNARLRLADLLHNLGRFDQAEIHYKILIRDSAEATAARSRSGRGGSPSTRPSVSASNVLAPYRARANQ